MNSVKTLIDRWAETRKEKALASALGVTPQMLSAYKHGTVAMPIERFYKLAELVDATHLSSLVLDYVRDRTEKMSETFRLLLRRGMALKSRTCALA